MIPSLEQEAIQNYRKHYWTQSDTKSTVEGAFLYNVVGDYFYNKNKIKDIEKHLRGKNKMINSERDENGRMRIVNFNNQNKSW